MTTTYSDVPDSGPCLWAYITVDFTFCHTPRTTANWPVETRFDALPCDSVRPSTLDALSDNDAPSTRTNVSKKASHMMVRAFFDLRTTFGEQPGQPEPHGTFMRFKPSGCPLQGMDTGL